MKFLKSENGFTLFTALLSIVLISLTWLLMSSMTNSESGTTSTIDDIKQHDEMQSIIDLQRADAMQVFNFRLRVDTEQFLTELDEDGLPTPNAFLINREMMQGDGWENIKAEFSRYFSSTSSEQAARGDSIVKMAARIANHLSNIIERSTDVRGYAIDLANYIIDCSSGTCLMVSSDVSGFTRVVNTMITMQAENSELMEPIQCDGDFQTCKGTFYINMDLGLLPEPDYQSLPKIKIVHRRSGRSLIEPILPKGVFRIYMPIRYFKALAGGKEVAEAIFGIQGEIDALATNPGATSNDSIEWNTACDKPNAFIKNTAEQMIKDKAAPIIASLNSPGDFEVRLANVIVNPDPKPFDNEPGTSRWRCRSKVSNFDAYVVFEEKNPAYKVSGDNPDKPVRYGIRIHG